MIRRTCGPKMASRVVGIIPSRPQESEETVLSALGVLPFIRVIEETQAVRFAILGGRA